MRIVSKPATNVQRALFHDLRAILQKYEGLAPIEILCLAAQLVGYLIAYQDHTKLTPEQILDLIGQNIEAGNAAALEVAFGETKGTA